MKKNKVLSTIVTLTAIISGNSSFNNVSAKSSETKNISSQKSVEIISESKDESYEKTSRILENTLKLNLDAIVRYNITVEITSDDLYEFKYKTNWRTWPSDFSKSLSNAPEFKIRSEKQIDKVTSKIVNEVLNYMVEKQGEDSLLKKFARTVSSMGKYSDVVDSWKKNGSYNSKIKEVGNEIIDKLIDKMRQAKDKNKK